MNILDYYKKVGLSLDQTQPPKLNKSQDSNIIFSNIIKTLLSLNTISQKYGITLTFKKKYHNVDPLKLHRDAITLLSEYNKKFKYILFPEFTQKGVLHYHGIIWDCYQLPFTRMTKKWSREMGFTKNEYEIKHYMCLTKNKCTLKETLNSLKDSTMCWYHYIQKDYGKNGLWALTNY